jgi:hypothetical protein
VAGNHLAAQNGDPARADKHEREEDYLVKNVANMDSLVSDLNNFLGRILGTNFIWRNIRFVDFYHFFPRTHKVYVKVDINFLHKCTKAGL